MKYKAGDKVRIVGKRTLCMNQEGKMDKWLGKVMTVSDVSPYGYYVMVEDDGEWGWFDEMLQGLEPESKIVITANGMEVLARLYDGKELVKSAKAKCSPDDEFNFMSGAEIALGRLKKPKFVPSLMLNKHIRFGTIGEKTNMTALFGEELFVGDIVEIYSTSEGEDGSHCCETHFVTKDSHGFRVDGLARGKIKNGIYGVWQIRKAKSYKDLKNNESVGYITAMLEEE